MTISEQLEPTVAITRLSALPSDDVLSWSDSEFVEVMSDLWSTQHKTWEEADPDKRSLAFVPKFTTSQITRVNQLANKYLPAGPSDDDTDNPVDDGDLVLA